MIRLCERFGSYGMYGQKPIEEELGRGLYQRHDAAMNYIRTGGRFGRRESFEQLAVRTNYFRETYAYDRPVVDGIEGFLWHEGLPRGGARALRPPGDRAGDRVREPAGARVRSWPSTPTCPSSAAPTARRIRSGCIVVMHHSGLFERWRMPIATGVSWFRGCRGGDFAFYPDGPPDRRPRFRRRTTRRSCSTRTASSTASTASPRRRRAMPPLRDRHAPHVRGE